MVHCMEQTSPAQSVLGPVFVFNRPPITPVQFTSLSPQAERNRLSHAQKIVTSHLNFLLNFAEKYLDSHCSSIFSAHITLLQELVTEDQLLSLIEQDHFTAEFAIEQTARSLSQLFAQLDSPYMQARGADIQDISYQLLHTLTYDTPYVPTLQIPSILLTDELYPSELMALPFSNLLGVACQHSSIYSHTALLLQHSNIPFCMNLPCSLPSTGQTVLLDVSAHTLYLNPDSNLRNSYGYP